MKKRHFPLERNYRKLSSRATPGSEAQRNEFVDLATAYGRQFPGTFGGAWFESIAGRDQVVVAFTGDLERHRAALDPRLRVVTRSGTAAELESVLRATLDWVSSDAVVDSGLSHSDQSVVVTVATDDEARLEQEVREKFGSTVDLYFLQANGSRRRASGAHGREVFWGAAV